MLARRIASIVLASVALGCGSRDASGLEPPASATPPATEGTGQTPPLAAEGSPPATTPGEPVPTARPSALDTATACERARVCCPAFVEAIEEPVEAERARIACEQMEHLGELGDASGEACLAALDGWRRALELAEREVPVSCR